MSDPQLKKQIEQLRGTPFPPPKPKKIEPKIKKKIEKLRGTPVPSPTLLKIEPGKPVQIKNYDDMKIVEYHLNKSLLTSKTNLDNQLKTITAQQQAIKDAKVRHDKIVNQRIGKKLTKKSKKAYEKYLDDYVKYLKKAEGNLSLSEKNVEKINKAIEDLKKQKGGLTAFTSKKDKVKFESAKYKITYKEDGKDKSKTFDTVDEAEKFAESISIPEYGPVQELMRSRIIKQTDLVDGKIYYELDKPVDKLTSGQRRLLERAGFNLPLPGKTEAKRYENQVESVTSWLADLIHADLIDKKLAEKTLKEVEPVYLSTVKYGPEPVGELIKKVDIKLAKLEEKAKYKEYEGYTLFGLKQYPPEVVKARVAHLGLSATVGAAKSAPFIALGTTGGPVISGLIAASMIATIANPENQAMLKQYVKEHPQQFVAELSGALALGYGVGQVKSLYNKYKNDIPDLYTQQLEMQLAKDTGVLPGPQPPEPSTHRALHPELYPEEPLHPWFEETVYTKFVSKLDPESALKFAKSADAVLYWGSGDEYGMPMSIYDLTELHPSLDKPMAIYLPNVRRLTPKYADLITKVPGEKGMYVMPSVVAAMSLIAQQGYITEEDIQNLIKSIENQNFKIDLDEITVPWSDEYLETITVPDVIAIVDSIPITVTTPIIESATDLTIDPITDFEFELDIPQIPPEEPYEVPPPKEPKFGMIPKSDAKMRRFRAKLLHGPKSKYNVDFHYRRKEKQSVTVEARSYPEALSRAQRVRRITHELPNMVDMRRVR